MSVNLAAPFVPTRRTRIEHLLQNQDPGKPARILAGSYVSDLVSLKKCLSLCLLCLHKFDAKAHNYVTRASLPRAHGTCDGCGDWHDANTLLFPAGQF